MNAKSGPKSGRFVKGKDARRGHGPAKGSPNAGRIPSAIAVLARTINERDQLLEIAAKIARSDIEASPGERLAAIKLVLSYGYGLPVQPVDTEGETPHDQAIEELA